MFNARGDLANLVIRCGEDGEPSARIQEREIDPELVEALIGEPGERHRHPVECVLLGQTPENARRHEAGVIGLEAPLHEGDVAMREVPAAELAHEVRHQGHELDEVPVAVDNRVIEARANPPDVVTRDKAEGHRQHSLE